MELLGIRVVRHGFATTAAVLAVAAAVGGASWTTWLQAQDDLTELTGRARGEIVVVGIAGRPEIVGVRWQSAGGTPRVSAVELAESQPPVGTSVEVAFDPRDPRSLTLPGSVLIASANRTLTNAACLAVIVLGVLAAVAYRVVTAARASRRPARSLRLRRMRLQNGLLSRSWLEVEDSPQRWVPVYFDPALVTLPSPTEVQVHGDPRRDRWVAATIGGRRVYPSGPVRADEPGGRRIDNPARPDADTARRARAASLSRQLRVDLALAVPAPLVGLFWAFLDGGGLASWLGATAVAATVGLWTGAYRGSDPS